MKAAAAALGQVLEPAAAEGLQEWQGLSLSLCQGVGSTLTQSSQHPHPWSLRRYSGQRSPGAYSFEQSEPAFTPPPWH